MRVSQIHKSALLSEPPLPPNVSAIDKNTRLYMKKCEKCNQSYLEKLYENSHICGITHSSYTMTNDNKIECTTCKRWISFKSRNFERHLNSIYHKQLESGKFIFIPRKKIIIRKKISKENADLMECDLCKHKYPKGRLGKHLKSNEHINGMRDFGILAILVKNL